MARFSPCSYAGTWFHVLYVAFVSCIVSVYLDPLIHWDIDIGLLCQTIFDRCLFSVMLDCLLNYQAHVKDGRHSSAG